jgi:hypothetical protein
VEASNLPHAIETRNRRGQIRMPGMVAVIEQKFDKELDVSLSPLDAVGETPRKGENR